MKWWNELIEMFTAPLPTSADYHVTQSVFDPYDPLQPYEPPVDHRPEYRYIKHHKSKLKDESDLAYEALLEQASKSGSWRHIIAPFNYGDPWRYSCERRLPDVDSWEQFKITNSDTMAKYYCNEDAQQYAAPVITNLGRLP
jgi:hypothetical protein